MTACVGCRRFASFHGTHTHTQNFIVAVHFDFLSLHFHLLTSFFRLCFLLHPPSLNHTNSHHSPFCTLASCSVRQSFSSPYLLVCSIDCVYLFKRPQFITIIFLLSLFVVRQLKGTFGFSIYSRVLLLLLLLFGLLLFFPFFLGWIEQPMTDSLPPFLLLQMFAC